MIIVIELQHCIQMHHGNNTSTPPASNSDNQNNTPPKNSVQTPPFDPSTMPQEIVYCIEDILHSTDCEKDSEGAQEIHSLHVGMDPFGYCMNAAKPAFSEGMELVMKDKTPTKNDNGYKLLIKTHNAMWGKIMQV